MSDDKPPADVTVLRDEITAALAAAGIRAIGYLPDRMDPPLALVQPGDPWITPSPTAGYKPDAWSVHHEVVLIVAPGDKRSQTTSLDSLTEDALVAVIPFGFEQVGQPYVLQLPAGDQYLAARIRLTTTR